MSILDRFATPSARQRRAKQQHVGEETRTYEAAAGFGFAGMLTGTLRQRRENAFRIQRQWITIFLVSVVALAMLAGLYLDVTTRAALAGREIQNLELQITTNERVNADLETNIAVLLSNGSLETRAMEMGYQPISRAQIRYLVVPGYFPQDAVTMVTPNNSAGSLAASPEFQQSLFDWFGDQMQAASTPLTNLQP